MVGKFREFLNTSPIFEDERRSLPTIWTQRRPSRRVPQTVTTGGSGILNGGDGAEDEAYDDENDYEGMDTMAPPGEHNVMLPYGSNALDVLAL